MFTKKHVLIAFVRNNYSQDLQKFYKKNLSGSLIFEFLRVRLLGSSVTLNDTLKASEDLKNKQQKSNAF